MNSPITPAEIVERRAADRRSYIIAHTPDVNGDFMARLDCCCYNCRDYLDPTGEEDAKRINDQLRVETKSTILRQDTLSVNETDSSRTRTREAIDESEDFYEPLPVPPPPKEEPTDNSKTQEKSS